MGPGRNTSGARDSNRCRRRSLSACDRSSDCGPCLRSRAALSLMSNRPAMPRFPLLAGKLFAIFVVSSWGALERCPGLTERRSQLMPHVEHRSHEGLKNRAENSHMPFRKRERTRQGFLSVASEAFRRSSPKSLRHHPRSTVPQHKFEPSTPSHGRVGSRECTACLKSAVSASGAYISINVTTPLRSLSTPHKI